MKNALQFPYAPTPARLNYPLCAVRALDCAGPKSPSCGPPTPAAWGTGLVLAVAIMLFFSAAPAALAGLPQLGGLETVVAQAAGGQQAGNQTGNSSAVPQPQSLGGALGGLLNAVGGALGGSQHVTPVDFRSLQALLPESLPGMKRASAEGANKQGMGVKSASAAAEYRGAGNQVIRVSISDVSGISGVLDLADALPKDTDASSGEGYEKDVSVGGRPMHEKYSRAGRQGSLQAIIARRFEVDVDGTGVSMEAVHSAMGQVDLSRLEGMKTQGVKN